MLADLVDRGCISRQSSIWLVDDGSQDATWTVIEGLSAHCGRFVGVKLSRNRGHQNALLAGLFSADGDAVISVDADLQDDLAVIESMVAAYRAGNEIVYGVRSERTTDTPFKRRTALAYYRLLRALGVDIIPNHADFRLLGREAIKALQLYGEVNLFLRGIIPQLGFASTRRVLCAAGARGRRDEISPFPDGAAGAGRYHLLQRGAAAADFGARRARLPVQRRHGDLDFRHPFCSPAGRSRVGRPRPCPSYFLGGIQLLCTGIVGEYVAKIYAETKGRPRFLVRKGGAPLRATRNPNPGGRAPHDNRCAFWPD